MARLMPSYPIFGLSRCVSLAVLSLIYCTELKDGKIYFCLPPFAYILLTIDSFSINEKMKFSWRIKIASWKGFQIHIYCHIFTIQFNLERISCLEINLICLYLFKKLIWNQKTMTAKCNWRESSFFWFLFSIQLVSNFKARLFLQTFLQTLKKVHEKVSHRNLV